MNKKVFVESEKTTFNNNGVVQRCNTCVNFSKTYEPKLCFMDRMAEAKSQYPQMSERACAALANDFELWEQKETGNGFCKYHNIEQQIPDHMSCLNHNFRKK